MRTLLLSLLLSLAVACAQALEIKDDLGRTHRFEQLPKRFVSMLPSLTESLWVLGVGSQLVGVDRYSNWPAEVAKLPHLGGLDDAQIEAIAALRPDVIVASTSARSLDKLEALGFKVVRLRSESHADVRRTLNLLAGLLGKAEAAEPLWTKLQAEIEVQVRRLPAYWRGRSAYFEIGSGPWAAGRASFIGETMTRLGLVNIVTPELGPFPKLNPEFVVRAAPEIVMGSRQHQAAMAARPGWDRVPAIQRGWLCGFDSSQGDVLVRPGPRLGEAAGLLVDCLLKLKPA
jgi:iron complex transport system substrate-binding protein